MMNNRQIGTALFFAAVMLVDTAAFAQGPVRLPQQVPATGAEDGRPRTPAEEQGVRNVQVITDHSFDGLTYTERSDGTLSIDLQGRFMNVMKAAPGQDGRLDLYCQTSPSATTSTDTMAPWLPVKGRTSGLLDTTALRARFLRAPIAVSKPAVLEVK